MLWLAGLALVSYGAAQLLPGVAVARQSSHYRDARNLMVIRDAAYGDAYVPSISAEQYATWKGRRQNLFDGFAFYQVTGESFAGAKNTDAGGRIAVASANLFSLLGLPVRFTIAGAEPGSGVPRLILSDEAWRRDFGADPGISGRTVQIGSNAAVVGGVAPPGFWRLPGKVDGWLLVSDDGIAGRTGLVIGHINPASDHSGQMEDWDMAAPRPDGTVGNFACAPLTERTRGPNDLFIFSLLLACLALPATTSLPLGEYRVTSQKLSWSTRLRRWGFLGCKVALLLPIVYFASLDLAHWRSSLDLLTSQDIQLASSFSICLFGLRWVLRDQRQRCPMCLRRLTNPARVGQPSRNFLAWNGTELICVAGHGLLHIPEIQTSWFDTQRWLYLDPSWDVLFVDPGLASAGYF
jgi:hypothetical protein